MAPHWRKYLGVDWASALGYKDPTKKSDRPKFKQQWVNYKGGEWLIMQLSGSEGPHPTVQYKPSRFGDDEKNPLKFKVSLLHPEQARLFEAIEAAVNAHQRKKWKADWAPALTSKKDKNPPKPGKWSPSIHEGELSVRVPKEGLKLTLRKADNSVVPATMDDWTHRMTALLSIRLAKVWALGKDGSAERGLQWNAVRVELYPSEGLSEDWEMSPPAEEAAEEGKEEKKEESDEEVEEVKVQGDKREREEEEDEEEGEPEVQPAPKKPKPIPPKPPQFILPAEAARVPSPP